MTDLRDQLVEYGRQHHAEQEPVTSDEIRWAPLANQSQDDARPPATIGLPRVWLLAAAAGLVLVLVGGIAFFSRTSPAVDSAGPEPIATPVDVAIAFIEARDARDLQATRALLADDVRINDNVRSIEGYELEFAKNDVLDWRFFVDQCEAGDPGPPFRVRCSYTQQNAWSVALGHGPFGGGEFVFDIEDGLIHQISNFIPIQGMGPLAWIPFADWVRDNHPEQIEVIFTDSTARALLTTPEALQTLERLTAEFVEAQEAGG